MKFIRFLMRMFIATALVGALFVFTQDIQIFPGVVPGFFKSGIRKAETLPYGVTSETIATSDNQVLETWYFNAEEPASEDTQASELAPLAIIFHGNADSVESSFDLQSWLSKQGISSLSFDYRGFGLSTGWPSDAGLKRDVLAVIKHASKKYDLANRKVILLGQSIGTGLASYASQFLPSATVVLLSPYTSLRQLISELPVLGYLRVFLWYDLESLEHVANLKENCLVIAHGMQDNTIPFKYSKRLQSIAPDSVDVRFVAVENAGHNDLMYIGLPEITKEIRHCLA